MYIGCFCVFSYELPYLDDQNQHQPQHGVMVKLLFHHQRWEDAGPMTCGHVLHRKTPRHSRLKVDVDMCRCEQKLRYL